eukprot:gnl/MRDRNA2_/MRDRNA2_85900_c0_seq1.p1 gnl/MRDRNA2_/MRDRNA2_85900_c0~~gnl/MRDRNA2_/MRDRNA2_85900_c0_seq1.p1  ORF type:complete len:523 (+),score=108.99 gnl/MRDRNA2_/MRDRNA2_85900_c0_seq1:55-1623(+)
MSKSTNSAAASASLRPQRKQTQQSSNSSNSTSSPKDGRSPRQASLDEHQPANDIDRSTITGVRAREIYDCRGNPTLEVDIETPAGSFRASVPSESSVSPYEALELRDTDHGRLRGQGCLEAVGKVNEVIGPALIGKMATEQQKIDRFICKELDGSQNEWGWSKSQLGSNTVLAVSMAVCRAGAAAKGITLYQHIAELDERSVEKFVIPVPAFNVISGGRLAGNRLACQGIYVLPVGASSFKEAMQIGSEVYHAFKSVVQVKYGSSKHARAANTWDDGGLAAPFTDDEDALDLLMEGIRKSGHEAKVKLSVHVSASNLFDKKDGRYDWAKKNFQSMGSPASMRKSPGEMIKLFQKWFVKYPFVSIEDPFNHSDLATYELFTKQIGHKVQIVGADLFGTNPKRVQQALKTKVCNAVAIIPSQVGSVSEAIEAAKLALNSGWSIVVSQRTGETEDSFLADLAVGLGANQINAGAPCRSERLAKYNQLLRIEQELSSTNTGYAGSQFPKGKFGEVEEESRKVDDTY